MLLKWFHGISLPPQQGNERFAAHQVSAAYGNHAGADSDVLLNDRNPLYIPVILDFVVVVVLRFCTGYKSGLVHLPPHHAGVVLQIDIGKCLKITIHTVIVNDVMHNAIKALDLLLHRERVND